jgi:anti-sigma regulatory factor (Ser/Thr protein kinase)
MSQHRSSGLISPAPNAAPNSTPARSMLALPGTARSPALARDLVRECLRGFPSDTLETALLLVSEVVTNAVRHAHSPLVLVVTATPCLVTVSVEDTSSDVPTPTAAPLDAEAGRGLALVETLAGAWGCDPMGPGKLVWFQLHPDPMAPA